MSDFMEIRLDGAAVICADRRTDMNAFGDYANVPRNHWCDVAVCRSTQVLFSLLSKKFSRTYSHIRRLRLRFSPGK